MIAINYNYHSSYYCLIIAFLVNSLDTDINTINDIINVNTATYEFLIFNPNIVAITFPILLLILGLTVISTFNSIIIATGTIDTTTFINLLHL